MKSIYIIIISTVVFLASCTERIELDLNSDDNVRLVVDAELTTESKVHEVLLTLTSDYFKPGQPDPATGAIVTLNDGESTETLIEISDGIYNTSEDYAGEVGKTYTLTIDYDDETYTSVSTITAVAPIDEIYLDYDWDLLNDPNEEIDFEEDENAYVLYGSFQEPATPDQYYLWRLKINGEYDGGVPNWFFQEDGLVNGNYIGDADVFYFFGNIGDEIEFEQSSISKEVYDYILALFLETEWRGGLFDGAPANVPPNISNGAVGVFITSDVSRLSLTIEE